MPTVGELLQHARQMVAGGQADQAEAIYRQLLAAVPQAAELWHELGLFLLRSRRPAEAVECLQRATTIDPSDAACWSNLGAIYRMLQRHHEAAQSFQRACQLGPPTALLYNNLALALKDTGQRAAALAAFDDALRLDPGYANGHFNRGNLLMDVGRLDEALASYTRAIALNPSDAGAHCKLGVACYDLARMDEALTHFERALALQPDYPEARRNRGLAWLAQGDYQRGWHEFEWRAECEGFGKRDFACPRWNGSPLAGRTLLVHAEQGLGDTLHFIRYVPLVELAGGRVRVEVQQSLAPLLKQSGFGRFLLAAGEIAPADFHSPLISLAASFPDHDGKPFWSGPYLSADERLVSHWADKLRSVTGLKVGIVWAGNPDHPHDQFRSVNLAQFAPLADVAGVKLVSLQKGAGATQPADGKPPFELLDLGPELDVTGAAFVDTAAVIKNLDLVVTVDTSMAHLAGALGVPTWLALHFSPDWRWQLTGVTTAWYPTMRLFRQTRFNCWDEVFAEMAAELGRRSASFSC